MLLETASIIEMTLLSIVQGLTEFLPVSSSAHLIFIAGFLKTKMSLDFAILVHIGSLIAIIAYFWGDIIRVIRTDRRLIILITVATIPAALAGILLEDYVKKSFQSSLIAASLLMVTGFYLFFSDRRAKETEIITKTTFLKVLLVGIAQAFALLPGLSRSGLTICTGLLCGWERKDAMRFSFLMAIPVMIGAGVLDLATSPMTIDITSSTYVILISFIFSMLALFVLKTLIMQRKLIIFAVYCLLTGVFMIVLSGHFQYA